MGRDVLVPHVFSPDGNYMTTVSSEYADKAVTRGEAARDEETGHLVVIPVAVNEMTELEKRKYRLAKERAAR
jgi:hypothetical protein